jgi:hypothetical protein
VPGVRVVEVLDPRATVRADRGGDVVGEVRGAPQRVLAGAGATTLLASDGRSDAQISASSAPREELNSAVGRPRDSGRCLSQAMERKTVSTGTRSSSCRSPGAPK